MGTAGNCYHGGAFFSAIGSDFACLERSGDIISADVLDAWFEPSPKVIEALRAYLPWALKTSPPTHCDGLIGAISAARGIPIRNICAEAGSSRLIFGAFPLLLSKGAKVLLLNPSYGEYKFFLENVRGCQVIWFSDYENASYGFDIWKLLRMVKEQNIDAVILVNPNNPTGHLVSRAEMEALCASLPDRVTLWVDEAYIDYAGREHSVEDLARRQGNVVVCKSMSKAYALSGARCAYLVADERLTARLRQRTPPWAVSLPAQVAGVFALKDYGYYQRRYEETKQLKAELLRGLERFLPARLLPGHMNSILSECEPSLDVGAFLEKCRKDRLYLRPVANMGSDWGANAFRVSVKDRRTNRAMLGIMERAV